MIEIIGKLAAVFADNRIVRTVNNGLINLIPFVLVGAVCLALLNLPIPFYQDALDALSFGKWRQLSELVTFATLHVIALAALLSVSYTYASEEPLVKSGDVHPFMPTFTAFACHIILFVWDGGASLSFSRPGLSGVFRALAVALLSAWLFFAFVKLRRRIRPPRLSILDVNLQMRTAFAAVFPVACTLAVAALVRVFAPVVLPLDAMQGALSDFIDTSLIREDLGAILLTVLLAQALWFIGVHGTGMILDEFPSISQLPDSSHALFATEEFYEIFVLLGGTGATLGFLIALFIAGSAHRGKRLARASLFPALFNINETLLYGGPIIFNPFAFIPFLFAPLLVATLSYFAFSIGAVPPITQATEWTTPVLLSGFLSTGSPAGTFLQLICVVCSVAIYLPFVIAMSRFDNQRRIQRIEQMQKVVAEAADDESIVVLMRNDEIGETARLISSRLHGYFENGTLPFYLVYQPKTDKDGQVVGAEALLRWENPEFGFISPVVLVELCDESGLATDLGRWITAEAMKEYVRWKQEGLCGLRLSINLHARHLREDESFPAFVGEVLARQGIENGEIELEITEHMALQATSANREALAEIRAFGVALSIDDMGIGYSSLTYISDFGVTCVKMDASLVSAIETDVQQQEIIRSIVQLSEQLGLTVIVEGVETKAQLDALLKLGVRCFQGYYFSKPLKPADFIAFVKEKGIRNSS
ncbi:MAG: EAL domain-containing protein [Coriobacteriales bacterium]|jgi:lactose/cellobiose-specific phosphotransferase system IIC component|nr:EAL domain-containing protein [Coriobacteriales bacterium]